MSVNGSSMVLYAKRGAVAWVTLNRPDQFNAYNMAMRDDLFQMRKALDQYAADKGKLPQSLDDLASSHYLREVPVDPMTDQKDWNAVSGDDPASVEGGQGVIDVHSSSTEQSSEGQAYSEW